MVEQKLTAKISSNISFIDKLLMCQSALLDCSLQEMSEGLLGAIKENGSVSYLIGMEGRFRTTPLASVIEALYDADMLPEDVLQVMQGQLYECRDKLDRFNSEEDEITKDPEDMAAWSVDEGPSVWTTSKTIFTLIKTGFHKICDKQQLDGLDRAVKWLVDQAYTQDNGALAWGFQHDESLVDCAPSIPMTALALKAIGIAYDNREIIHKGEKRKNGYFRQYIYGVKYLIEKRHEEDGKCYWEYDSKASITATVLALEAMGTLKRDTNIVSQEELQGIKKRALNWIIEFFNGSETSTSDPFFKYQITKYKRKEKIRVFYAFVPYYASFLIKNGVSPFHPKICACIRWLIENKEKNWAINDYNSPEPCSFSAAMAINTIVVWLRCVNEQTYQSIAAKIISNRIEDICNNCVVYEQIIGCTRSQQEEEIEKPSSIELKAGPHDKGKYAILFIGIGVLAVVGLIFLFKDQAIALLSNTQFIEIVKWILLAVVSSLIGLAVKAAIKLIKNYRGKNTGPKSMDHGGESLDG
ncbi:MAG TPA: hypothetical protein PKE52_07550 [Bacteroidales bacterium]|nr:hypothetical protein [Bacteroidales bacterium]